MGEKIKIISLFSGAGGLDLGFEKAGFGGQYGPGMLLVLRAMLQEMKGSQDG